jgi:hypothetical protein
MIKHKGVVLSHFPSTTLPSAIATPANLTQSSPVLPIRVVVSRLAKKMSLPRLSKVRHRDLSIQPTYASEASRPSLVKQQYSLENKPLRYNFTGFKQHPDPSILLPASRAPSKFVTTPRKHELARRLMLIGLSYLKQKKYSVESLQLIDAAALQICKLQCSKLLDKLEVIGGYLAKQRRVLNLKDNLLCYESSALLSQYAALLSFVVDELI